MEKDLKKLLTEEDINAELEALMEEINKEIEEKACEEEQCEVPEDGKIEVENNDVYPDDECKMKRDVDPEDVQVNEEELKVEVENSDVYPEEECKTEVEVNTAGVQEDPATRELEDKEYAPDETVEKLVEAEKTNTIDSVIKNVKKLEPSATEIEEKGKTERAKMKMAEKNKEDAKTKAVTESAFIKKLNSLSEEQIDALLEELEKNIEDDVKELDVEVENDEVYPEEECKTEVEVKTAGVQEDPETRELKAEELAMTEEDTLNVEPEVKAPHDDETTEKFEVEKTEQSPEEETVEDIEVEKTVENPEEIVDNIPDERATLEVEVKKPEENEVEVNITKTEEEPEKVEDIIKSIDESFEDIFRVLREAQVKEVEVVEKAEELTPKAENSDVYPEEECKTEVEVETAGVQEDPATRELKAEEVSEESVEKISEALENVATTEIVDVSVENKDVYNDEEYKNSEECSVEDIAEDPATRELEDKKYEPDDTVNNLIGEEVYITKSFTPYTSIKEALMTDKEYFTENTYVEVEPKAKEEKLIEQLCLMICKESNDPIYSELVKHASYVKTLTEACKKKYSNKASKKASEIIQFTENWKDDGFDAYGSTPATGRRVRKEMMRKVIETGTKKRYYDPYHPTTNHHREEPKKEEE